MGAKGLGQEITKPIQLERTKPIQACIYTSHARGHSKKNQRFLYKPYNVTAEQ